MTMPAAATTITSSLHNATDDQLREVVALIDALPVRGAADTLLADLRPRIAEIRPARPLTVSRVLCAPLEPLLVTGACQPGDLSISRAVLKFINEPVGARLAPLCDELARAIGGASICNRDALLVAGRRLWPAAAPVVASLPTPPDWQSCSGLPDSEWFDLREGVAAILARACQIEAVLLGPASEEALKRLLGTPPPAGATLARLLRILLARHPNPAEIAAAAAHLDCRNRPAAERALNEAAESALLAANALVDAPPAAAANTALHIVATLEAVDSPARRHRVAEIRTRAASACETRATAVIDENVLHALAGARLDDDAVMSVESSARDAVKLATAARTLNARSNGPAMLRRAAEQVAAAQNDDLDEIDKARLIEILLGPGQTLPSPR